MKVRAARFPKNIMPAPPSRLCEAGHRNWSWRMWEPRCKQLSLQLSAVSHPMASRLISDKYSSDKPTYFSPSAKINIYWWFFWTGSPVSVSIGYSTLGIILTPKSITIPVDLNQPVCQKNMPPDAQHSQISCGVNTSAVMCLSCQLDITDNRGGKIHRMGFEKLV